MNERLIYDVTALVPVTIRVRAHDEEAARNAALMCRLGIVGGLAVVGGSSGFPENVSVRQVEAGEPDV